MKIIRVFPRRTAATPTDNLVRIDCGPGLFDEGVDEVHVSCTFTWDLPKAKQLVKQWEPFAPTKLGGPATGMRGEEFTPGLYIKKGYVITSRGCPNRCWFCSVWKREGREVRTLPIVDGWHILDDNLLACPEEHIRSVFSMLSKQNHRPHFTGGLEAARLKQWHVDELVKLKAENMFFAYDTPDDREPLVNAMSMMIEAGFNRDKLKVYVLCGYPHDTISSAESRVWEVVRMGAFPYAMLYEMNTDREWRKFQTQWVMQPKIAAKIKDAQNRKVI